MKQAAKKAKTEKPTNGAAAQVDKVQDILHYQWCLQHQTTAMPYLCQASRLCYTHNYCMCYCDYAGIMPYTRCTLHCLLGGLPNQACTRAAGGQGGGQGGGGGGNRVI